MDRSAGHAARHHAQHRPREPNGTHQRLMQWPEVPVKAEDGRPGRSTRSASSRLDGCQAWVENFGAHAGKFHGNRHLFTAAKGVGDLANTEAGMDHLIAHTPAFSWSRSCLAATHGIGWGSGRSAGGHPFGNHRGQRG